MRSTAKRSRRRSEKKETSGSAAQILQAALKEDCSAGELSDMACADPIFAGRILAWVNSPAFALSRTITDVRQATSLLGVRGLRNIALSMLVAGMAPPSPKSKVLLANGLRRALAAHSIAEFVARDQADSAFTTGLFLDAGLLALAAKDIDAAAELAEGPAAHRVLKERALGYTPHPEAGAELAKGYGLPFEMVHAIEHHHDEEAPQAPLSRVAWAAEKLAAVFEGGSPEAARTAAKDAAKVIGLAQDVLEDLLNLLPQMVVDGAKIFDRDVGEQLTMEELVFDANTRLLQLNAQYEQTVAALEKAVEEKEAMAQLLWEANERLHVLASHDPLTGLVNRRIMNSELENHLSLADRQGTSLTVALVDLDHFKRVNDTHGHDMGDEVLKVVAKVLQSSLRGSDIVARFGGEEFVLILPGTSPEQAAAVLDRTRQLVAGTPIIAGGKTINVTASIGGAGITGPGCSDQGDNLLKCADLALYAAKDAGRNRVVMS